METIDLLVDNFKDLKAFITKENEVLRDEIKNRCDYCLNIPVVKKEIENHWFHIISLWSSFLLLGSSLISLGILFFKGKN